MAQYFSYPSCEFTKNLTRTQSAIHHVAFDRKGKFLATGGDDGVIRLVNIGIVQYTVLKGHTDAVLCVAFDPKGEFFASSSADGTVRAVAASASLTREPLCVLGAHRAASPRRFYRRCRHARIG